MGLCGKFDEVMEFVKVYIEEYKQDTDEILKFLAECCKMYPYCKESLKVQVCLCKDN